jgi:hypothetical protein
MVRRAAPFLPAGRGGGEEKGRGPQCVWCATPGRPRWRGGAEFAAVRTLRFLGVPVPWLL